MGLGVGLDGTHNLPPPHLVKGPEHSSPQEVAIPEYCSDCRNIIEHANWQTASYVADSCGASFTSVLLLGRIVYDIVTMGKDAKTNAML